MQTFLPYADFDQAVRCLDMQRLGNQRNETSVIIKTIVGMRSGRVDPTAKDGKTRQWSCHPAVLQWYGYLPALKQYQRATIREFIRRGGNNNMAMPHADNRYERPWWLGIEEYHASHRGNLLRKSDWYEQFEWLESPDAPYVWPVQSKHVRPNWARYRRSSNAYKRALCAPFLIVIDDT